MISLTASVAAVLVFVSASSYFVYRYYDRIVKEHYVSLLRTATAMQTRLLSGDSYQAQMASMGGTLAGSPGVLAAWFTDRYGSLVHHTDRALMEEYRAKRLPHPFREHIEQVWRFEAGSPVPVVTRPGWNTLRFSLPLYAAGKTEHDFVAGLDARRFIFLPDRMSLIAAFAGGYLLAATALLFFPLFFMVRRQMRQLQSQTLALAGTARAGAPPGDATGAQQPPPSAGEPAEGEPAPEERAGGEPVHEAQIKGRPEEQAAEAPRKPEEAGVEKGTAAQAPPEVMNPRELFLKIREKQFSGKVLDLPFLEGAGFVLHPARTDGVYQFYHKVKTDHFYCMFSTPSEDESRNLDLVPEIRTAVRRGLNESSELKAKILGYNELFRKQGIFLHLSLLHIDAAAATVSYTSCGGGYALYLKQGLEEVKELRLRVPRLGETDRDGFEEAYESADISFTGGDIFVAMPPNASDIRLHGRLLDYAVRDAVLAGRDTAAAGIGETVMQAIHELEADEQARIPETGLVILRFV